MLLDILFYSYKFFHNIKARSLKHKIKVTYDTVNPMIVETTHIAIEKKNMFHCKFALFNLHNYLSIILTLNSCFRGVIA